MPVLKSSEVPKTPTRGMTFRLPSDTVNQLRKVSEARNVSTNTLFNQIITAFLDWHSMASDAKLYYLPKLFLIRLINELTEKELDELAWETAKNDVVDISLFLKGGFTIASMSDIVETWLKIAQMPYRFEITGESCKIIIEHDMGSKYSHLIKGISRYLLEVAFDTKSLCDVTDNAVIIKVELSRM